MTLVGAVGCTGVIGRDGDLPWECTGDLVLFGWVIMGYPRGWDAAPTTRSGASCPDGRSGAEVFVVGGGDV